MELFLKNSVERRSFSYFRLNWDVDIFEDVTKERLEFAPHRKLYFILEMSNNFSQ